MINWFSIAMIVIGQMQIFFFTDEAFIIVIFYKIVLNKLLFTIFIKEGWQPTAAGEIFL